MRPKDPVDLRKQDGVVYNAAKYTLAKQAGACMNGLRSTLGIYMRLSQAQTSAVSEHPNKTSGNIRSGLSLFTETLTGTIVELRKLFT